MTLVDKAIKASVNMTLVHTMLYKYTSLNKLSWHKLWGHKNSRDKTIIQESHDTQEYKKYISGFESNTSPDTQEYKEDISWQHWHGSIQDFSPSPWFFYSPPALEKYKYKWQLHYDSLVRDFILNS